jgi:RNA polymerase sigma-70 factor (ECF subfamily)
MPPTDEASQAAGLEAGATEDDRERTLLAVLRQDRRRAFAALVEAYERRLYSFASRMCRNTEDARDVLQDTFLSAFRALDQFRAESKLSTWLFRIAANACRKMRRRGKFEPERELSLDEFMPGVHEHSSPRSVDPAHDPEAFALTTEIRDALDRGIGDLPGPSRMVLVLRDVEGFSAEEVAEILGISVGAVKSRLHRARLFLRERLGEHAPRPGAG